jgi:pimeloyl-ACP methyl ester carboxylesterase
MDTSPHSSDFVNVNGIRLHYLDWGGEGPVLLFLAGWGCTAHIFDCFAPRFVDRFRVLALTRRGHGQSDYPETGYDIDTLTEDIRQFMDCLKIDQAILAGHSLAGIELSHFAAQHPERVSKILFLDAAYDRSSPAFKATQAKNPLYSIQRPGENEDHYTIAEYTATIKRGYPSLAVIWSEVFDTEVEDSIKWTPEGKVVDKMTDDINKAIQAMIDTYRPEDALIQAPVLSFFVLTDSANYVADFMSDEQRAQVVEFFETVRTPYDLAWIEQFQRNVPHARVVVIPQGHHYCFIQQADLVFNEMWQFLLE